MSAEIISIDQLVSNTLEVQARDRALEHNYGIQRNTNDAASFQTDVDNFQHSYGPSLDDYLNRHGRALPKDLKIGSGNLPEGAIAATIKFKGRTKNGKPFHSTYVVSNNDRYEAKATSFARDHNLSVNEAKVYVIAHEMMHAAGYKSEIDADTAVMNYFKGRVHKAEGRTKKMYSRLYEAAAKRVEGHKNGGSKIIKYHKRQRRRASAA